MKFHFNNNIKLIDAINYLLFKIINKLKMALAVMTPYTAIFLALGTFVFSE